MGRKEPSATLRLSELLAAVMKHKDAPVELFNSLQEFLIGENKVDFTKPGHVARTLATDMEDGERWVRIAGDANHYIIPITMPC